MGTVYSLSCKSTKSMSFCSYRLGSMAILDRYPSFSEVSIKLYRNTLPARHCAHQSPVTAPSEVSMCICPPSVNDLFNRSFLIRRRFDGLINSTCCVNSLFFMFQISSCFRMPWLLFVKTSLHRNITSCSTYVNVNVNNTHLQWMQKLNDNASYITTDVA